MAGSKGSKPSLRKGNLKYSKSEVSQTSSNIHLDGPRDPNRRNPEAVVHCVLPTSESSFTIDELEQLLHVKLDMLYTEAQDRLLKSGYSKAEVESAILHAGSVRGNLDMLNNVCQNTIAYIERKVEPRAKAFKDSDGLYPFDLETMVDSVEQTRQKQVWHLLAKNWGFIPSTRTLSHQQSRDKSSIWFRVSCSLSRNEDIGSLNPSSGEKVLSGMQIDTLSKKAGLSERINSTVALLSHLKRTILIHTDAVLREIEDPVLRLQTFSCLNKPTKVPNIVRSDFLRSLNDCSYAACLIGCLESDSDDPKAALIVDLVKNISELHEKVNNEKEWAQKKVIGSSRKIGKDLLELKILRMEEFNKELHKRERIYIEKSCIVMLIETEQGLKKVNNAAVILNDTMKRLSRENAKLRADIQGIKLDVTEYENESGKVLKRERRGLRKHADVEKQTIILQSQLKEEKQRATQLEDELLQADRELFEDEMKWRHKVIEKEHMYAILAEEMKKVETQKANSRAQLLRIQQKVDIDRQLARDDLQRLENDLKCLRICNEMPDTFLEDESFWCDGAESSSGSSAQNESSKETIRHWICMMCLQNEVSIVFLPCTHQVLCAPCYSENFKTVGGSCPYCHVKIEESIKAYGASF